MAMAKEVEILIRAKSWYLTELSSLQICVTDDETLALLAY